MLFTLLSYFIHSAFALHVVIDAGHGGVDTGATHNEKKESEIVLAVTQKLAEVLKEDDRFTVTLTREKENFLSLEERTEIANKSKADVFLSIHVNWSEDKSVKGKEIYFQNQLPPDEESLYLASRENQGKKVRGPDKSVSSDSDLTAIIEDLNRNSRIQKSGLLSEFIEKSWPSEQNYKKNKTSIRQAPFYVISNVNMPSCLVELGFISNASEATKLTDPAYQKKLAAALHNGLIQFKELVDKTTRQRLN
jgi:N-acetylmuramoyl-L-alanine amidase